MTKQRRYPRNPPLPIFLTIFLVVIAGLLLTAALFWEARQEAQNNFQLQFERDAAMRCNLIAQKMEECLVVIKGLQRFFTGSEHVDSEQFATFTVPFLVERKELLALEWVPRVSSAERSHYEGMGRRQKMTDFRITERDPNGIIIPAGEREAYYPVLYVEPLKGNEKAIGFDLGSDPIRGAALERAGDTGEVTVTERIRLLQEPGEQFGFLVFFPVYRRGMPAETVEKRRAALEGFSLGVFRAGDVLWTVLGSTEPIGLQFDLLDLSAPAERHLLHRWSARLNTKDSWKSPLFPIPPRYLWRFAFAGRQWGVETTASQVYLELYYPFAYWLILPAGFLLTAVLGFYLRAILGQRVQLERTVLERTSELQESEERFRTIFDSVNDAVFVFDLPTGAILDVNQCMCELYGYTRDEACNLDISVLGSGGPPFSRQDLLQRIEEAAKGEPQIFDWRAKDKAGRFFWVELNLRHASIGGKERLLITARDITERKNAEEVLRDSELRLRTILQTANEGFWLIDNDTVTRDVNPRMCAILGRDREEILGRKIFDFVDNEDRAIFEHRIRWGGQGKPGAFEIALSRPDGSHVFCHFSGTPLFDGTGNMAGAFAMVTDISKRKQAEDALRESQQMLHLVLDTIPVRVFWKDLDSNYLGCNRPFALDAGLQSPVEIIGRNDFEVDWAEQAELYRSDDRLVMETGRPKLGYEEPRTKPDGGRIWLRINKVPLLDDEGRAKGVLGTYEDITERKRAEDERTRLATAIEQAAEAIFITAPDWIIQYVNPAFESLTGYNNIESIGQHTRILRSYQHKEAFYRKIEDTLARGEVWSGRLVNKKKEGTFYDAEATVSPVRDKSGAIINYVSIHRDITNEVRLEAELHQAQKMEAIGLLAGGIAHDFNNILAAIMGFTELSLFKIPEDSPIRRNLEQVLKATSRASGVVKQILTFTHKGVQDRKPLKIAPIVYEALKLLRSSLPSTIEIRQEVSVMPGEDVVLADPGQIHQILMNLSTNAGHAMKAQGGTLTVKLSVITDASQLPVQSDLKEGRYVCIAVSDTGHGMDSPVLERIFDPYFTTKGPGEGTGLGLSVVQGIVRSHGGAITVRSEPGQGTTFFVFLPGLEGVDVEDTKAFEALPTGSERILLVDDEEALVDLGKQMLETLGYHVTAKTSSRDALETFRAQPDAFDLVITDMTMPYLTGRELAEEMITLRSDTPIILSTGFSDLVNEEQAKESGIREFVMKPYEIRTLAGAIRKALEKR